jgi:hypothetical protein
MSCLSLGVALHITIRPLKKETTLLPFIHSLPSKRHRPSRIHST